MILSLRREFPQLQNSGFIGDLKSYGDFKKSSYHDLTEKTKYNIYLDFKVIFICNKNYFHVGKVYPKLEV